MYDRIKNVNTQTHTFLNLSKIDFSKNLTQLLNHPLNTKLYRVSNTAVAFCSPGFIEIDSINAEYKTFICTKNNVSISKDKITSVKPFFVFRSASLSEAVKAIQNHQSKVLN